MTKEVYIAILILVAVFRSILYVSYKVKARQAYKDLSKDEILHLNSRWIAWETLSYPQKSEWYDRAYKLFLDRTSRFMTRDSFVTTCGRRRKKDGDFITMVNDYNV